MTMEKKVNWTFREPGLEAIRGRGRQHRIGLSNYVHQAQQHQQEGPIGLLQGSEFVEQTVGD
jgi:hypothetical protein